MVCCIEFSPLTHERITLWFVVRNYRCIRVLATENFPKILVASTRMHLMIARCKYN